VKTGKGLSYNSSVKGPIPYKIINSISSILKIL